MLASQRRAAIVAIVEEHGAARVSELVERLGVSDMTVRRDIERLDGEGLLERVHGGAVAAAPRAADEPGFSVKSTLMTAEKQAVAAEAARLVQPGATIGISAGTTTYELARVLRAVPQLTVVTNSVPVAQLLHESAAAGHVVVLTGGVRTPSDALVGPVAVTALGGLHVDRLFLGAHGIDRWAGLTTPNLVEAETNRALVRSARTVCVLADHTKVGIIGLSTFMGLSEVDTLITDSGVSAKDRAVLEESVMHLVRAEPTGGPSASSRADNAG
ncbi:DeoR/GlpR transcriptional regulator [Phycicoccus sp. CSK15P-2]|uniref:DeoR/GlpR family DNA-binding transcription regulator n=1 Tax=Phycicoccus sp. CSK15P-2 TaxID=2807627 RepID=UPI00194FD93F|nr:DeoR/GlpR family DNA-binding transcription regulator [Phycicoccus sp. CSK15P-2]MBM6403280.1 DeoR/GlpR transcriptional regulator [Phycicoccus sp. CSK15P-2]